MSYRGIAYIPKQQLMRLFTWDEIGNRTSVDCTYEPYIYLESTNNHDATSIFETGLRKRVFKYQGDRYKYLKDNETTRVFENLPPAQQFLVDTFWDKNDLPEFSKNPIKVYFIDIETYSPDCFPSPENPEHVVNVITIYDTISKHFYSWGLKPCLKEGDNRTYVHCRSEQHLFDEFMSFIEKDYPDILSGWNCEFFDIPYIINRIKKLFCEEEIGRLSPVGRVFARKVFNKFGREQDRWYIDGVACVDYMDIYRKFCTTLRESYKLASIGEIELGETKIDFGDQNLSSLADNNWDLFVDYNIQDVNLLVKLEAKLRYLELLRMMAYAGCTTFEAALGTLSVVTGLCAIKARSKNLKIPTFIREDTGGKNEGAYVGEPQRGFQEHIISFDANSLYPNVMITLNISPETKIGKIEEVTDDKITIHHVNGQSFSLTPKNFSAFIDKEQIAISKAKILFSQKAKGIVPDIVDTFYQKRVEMQRKLKALKKREMSLKPDTQDYYDNKKLIDYLDIRQFTIKILINSIYGYFGNKRAPLGDDDIARSITLTGQAVIKHSNVLLTEFIKNNSALTDKDLEKYSPIIYNDTDSCYVSIKKIVDHTGVKMIDAGNNITPEYHKMVKDLEEHLNVGIKQWGIDNLYSKDCRLLFKRELIADAGVFLQKKRYVVRMLDKEGIPCSKFKYVGVEVVRTTMPAPIKPRVKNLIETMILTRSQAATNKILTETYHTFKSLPINDIAFVMGIKGYEKYASQCSEFKTAKHMPIHVKAGYFYNKLIDRFDLVSKYEKIGTGDKIRYFYIKQPNKLGLSVIGYKYKFPVELEKILEPDHEKMFEKIIFSVMERFYESVGWKIASPSMAAQTDLFDLLGV